VTDFIEIFLRAGAIVLTVLILTRLRGLKSFSKMSSFDFALTLAIGSTVATGILAIDRPLWHYLAGLAAIYLLQIVLSRVRVWSGRAKNAMDNSPLLLMEDGTVLEKNLAASGLARSEFIAKLRDAGVTSPGAVRAVVLETTGDVSVPTGSGPVDPDILDAVRRTP